MFGTTVYGGTSGTGSIYRVNRDGSYERLYSFGSTDDNGRNAVGAYPQAGVVFGPSGDLYGTTVQGGANGTGTIFKLTLSDPPIFSSLYAFGAVVDGKNGDGAEPYAGLVAGNDGYLYGNTHAGGKAGNGTIFRVGPDNGITTLHEFSAYEPFTTNTPDGAHPLYRLTAGPDGLLYGTTENGGEYGSGVLFQVAPDGTFTTLHSFGATQQEGNEPTTVTVGKDGALYGTTGSSADSGYGSIFRFDAARGLRTLYTFAGRAGEGNQPGRRSALVQAADGFFYGTGLGDDGLGIIYRFVPEEAFETLYAFGSAAGDLTVPETTLLEGSEGRLYGTASAGQRDETRDGGIFAFERDLVAPVSLVVAPSMITLGETAMLNWSTTGFSHCFASRSWEGQRENLGSEAVTPVAPGTYLYELSCYNESGLGKATRTVILSVRPSAVVPVEATGSLSISLLLIFGVVSILNVPAKAWLARNRYCYGAVESPRISSASFRV